MLVPQGLTTGPNPDWVDRRDVILAATNAALANAPAGALKAIADARAGDDAKARGRYGSATPGDDNRSVSERSRPPYSRPFAPLYGLGGNDHVLDGGSGMIASRASTAPATACVAARAATS